MTMLVVTHEMGFAKEVAYGVIFDDNGIVIEESPPSELQLIPSMTVPVIFKSK